MALLSSKGASIGQRGDMGEITTPVTDMKKRIGISETQLAREIPEGMGSHDDLGKPKDLVNDMGTGPGSLAPPADDMTLNDQGKDDLGKPDDLGKDDLIKDDLGNPDLKKDDLGNPDDLGKDTGIGPAPLDAVPLDPAPYPAPLDPAPYPAPYPAPLDPAPDLRPNDLGKPDDLGKDMGIGPESPAVQAPSVLAPGQEELKPPLELGMRKPIIQGGGMFPKPKINPDNFPELYRNTRLMNAVAELLSYVYAASSHYKKSVMVQDLEELLIYLIDTKEEKHREFLALIANDNNFKTALNPDTALSLKISEIYIVGTERDKKLKQVDLKYQKSLTQMGAEKCNEGQVKLGDIIKNGGTFTGKHALLLEFCNNALDKFLE